MAFNVGITSKQAFKELKKLTPQRRLEAVSSQSGASWLSMLTATEFAELFPKYYQARLPDVGGFRDAISKMSQQRQDDINFGLGQGAKSLEEAEQMGSWRRRLSGGGPAGKARASGAYSTSVGEGYGAGYEKAGASRREIAEYIRAAAAKRGIDPNIAVRVAKSEGLNTYIGDKGSSFGPFQLHYGGIASGGNAGSGEGDLFTKKTGLDARNPATWRQQIDFSLDRAKVNGWGAWHGAARVGISEREGLNIQPFNYTPKAGAGEGGTPSGSAPNFGQYAMYQGINSYHGDCGKGTRRLAGHMFGNNYFFDKGIGSGANMYAGSLSSGNNYFQSSGLYKSGRPIGRDGLSQDYLNSLPIGTVVSSQGGSNGGHVQIKIGPNQWASDTVQSGFYYGNGYGNFVIHEPNDTGMAVLAKNGVVQPGAGGQYSVTTAVETTPAPAVAPERTAAPAAPAPKQPEIPPEVPDAPEQNPAKTATVNKPAPTPTAAPGPKSFDINRQELINAIKQTDEFKNTFGSSLASDNMIYEGFFSDARTKKLMADTGSSFDSNTGRVKIGDYEKFKSAIGMDTTKIMTEVASSTPSHAGGGREKVKGPIHMHQLKKPRRGDTALVTDARGKQFTVNPQKEHISVNKTTGVMDIKPKKATEQMDMEKLLAMVRRQESGKFEGNYSSDRSLDKLKKGQKKSSASGAYQYTNDTWSEVLNKELKMGDLHKKYPRAVAAPKEVQDMVTQKRFEKWRSQGHSDHEIILRHFTGNFEGKLDPKAAKGNPTPAQYAKQLASHSSEYDKLNRPAETQVAQQQTAPKAEATKAAPAETPSMTERFKAAVSPLIAPPAASAAVKKDEGPVSGSVDFAPSVMDENYTKQPELMPARADKTSMIPEKAQTPVSISPMDQRPSHGHPTPSMARAMAVAQGKGDEKYTFGTNLGSK